MIGVLTGIAANFLKGGGGGAAFMQMSQGAVESRAAIQNRVVASRQANAQIEKILQKELELAYRDPQVAAQRIFKDIV